MRKYVFYRKYLFLAAFIFLLVSLPTFLIENVRIKLIALFSPSWKTVNNLLGKKEDEQVHRLEGENHLLRIEIAKLHALLEQKRQTDAAIILPAEIIYRDPESWTSSVWIDVGEEDNKVLGQCVVAKNSPVIVGKAVVGAIDFVGKRQSRVRLITDVALKPSVRVLRGYHQKKVLREHLQPILRYLREYEDTYRDWVSHLESLQAFLSEEKEDRLLAKGILQGGGTPFWRSVNHTLRGVGFNYDFSDKEGPGRELASGKPLDSESSLLPMPLIKVGDLLVTTGMDGVFPQGLRVAEVSKVLPLQEGAYTYEIEATPLVGNLDTLQTVFVIPPLGYDPADQLNQWK
ncbi:MAG: rod shape-determining protein MreC [Chlamydiales bacterium]